MAAPLKVGVISDTHGLLRPEALLALRGCQRILHAGDVGGPEILASLRRVAPVTAVRGNNDHGSWARDLPHSAELALAGVRVLMIHDVKELDPAGIDADVVVAGHSHSPRCERVGGVLFLNPGSAGPRRFRLPIAVARLHLRDGRAQGRIIVLG